MNENEETMEKLVSFYMKTKQSESIMNLGGALAVAQGQMRAAYKDQMAEMGTNRERKYASLDSIWNACRSPLSDNGLSVVQIPTNDGETFSLETILMHSSGEWISGSMVLPVTVKNMTEAQAIGTSISYARRYMLSSMVGVTIGDDNDGQKEDRQPEPAQQQQNNSTPSPEDNWPATIEGFIKSMQQLKRFRAWSDDEIKDALKANGHAAYSPQYAPQMLEDLIKAELDCRNKPMPQAQAVEAARSAMGEIEADAATTEDQPVAGDLTSDELAETIANDHTSVQVEAELAQPDEI